MRLAILPSSNAAVLLTRSSIFRLLFTLLLFCGRLQRRAHVAPYKGLRPAGALHPASFSLHVCECSSCAAPTVHGT